MDDLHQLRLERDSAIERLEDAETKLERMADFYMKQLNGLREERTALRKGMSTMSMRVEEVMGERDAARAKLHKIKEIFGVWLRRECTGWDACKELEKILT